MKRGLAALILICLGGGTAAGTLLHRARGAPGASEARIQYQKALEHFAAGRVEAYVAASTAAMDADPEYLEPFLHHLRSSVTPSLLQLRPLAQIDRVPDPALRACLRLAHQQRVGHCYLRTNVERVRDAAELCAFLNDLSATFGADPERLVQLLEEALRLLPGSPSLLRRQIDLLATFRMNEELWRVTGRLARSAPDPVLRAHAFAMQALAAHRTGRHREALRIEQQGLAFSRAAGAGALWEYAQGLAHHSSEEEVSASADSMWQQHSRAAFALALELRREAALRGDAYSRLRWLLDEGVRRLDTGDLAGSKHLLDGAIALAGELRDGPALTHSLMRRGRLHVKRGELAAAERDLLRAAAVPGPQLIYTTLEIQHNLLHLYEGLGDDAKAEQAGLRFIGYTEATGDCAVRIVAHRDLALFYQQRGRLREAEQQFRLMVQNTDRQQHEFLWAGEYYELIGQLEQAQRYYQLEWERGGSPLRALPGLIRLADLRGDTLLARRWARLHDQWLPAQKNPEAIPLLPGVVAARGDLRSALHLYEIARAEARAQDRLASWAILTADQARAELQAGHAGAAVELADSAQLAAGKLGARALQARAQALADLARLAGRPPPAEAAATLRRLQQTRLAAERMRLPDLTLEVRRLEAEAHSLLGQVPEALAAYRQADLITDSIARFFRAEPSRASYRAAHIGLTNRALSLILATGGPDATARFAEWSAQRKARTLREAGDAGSRVQLPALQIALSPHEAIIDYTLLDTCAVALLITRDTAVLTRLPAGAQQIARAARAFRMHLESRLGNLLDVGRARLDVPSATWLYDVLARPLEGPLRGKHRLYIVPDGELHLLPFDVLVSRTAPAPEYLLDRYELSLVPSLVLSLARAPASALDHVLVAGATRTSPAPGSAAEIDAVAAALAPHVPVILQDTAATVRALALALPQASIVHFAVHAESNELEPLHAALHLEAESGGDDVLRAADIARLDFAGKRVVLSACETAAGRLLAGEGVLNLSRAFLTAGAESTVATLWPVGPATAHLMGAYYRSLARGTTSAAALREAKNELRREPRFSHPLYWAPFVIIGNTLEPAL